MRPWALSFAGERRAGSEVQQSMRKAAPMKGDGRGSWPKAQRGSAVRGTVCRSPRGRRAHVDPVLLLGGRAPEEPGRWTWKAQPVPTTGLVLSRTLCASAVGGGARQGGGALSQRLRAGEPKPVIGTGRKVCSCQYSGLLLQPASLGGRLSFRRAPGRCASRPLLPKHSFGTSFEVGALGSLSSDRWLSAASLLTSWRRHGRSSWKSMGTAIIAAGAQRMLPGSVGWCAQGIRCCGCRRRW